MCSKPSVATKAVRAPLCSSKALVATVVPCVKRSTRSAPTARAAASTDSSCRAAVGTLAVRISPSRKKTASVNVPPTSMPSTRTKPMIAELRLLGAGGEPVDFRRPLPSHGVASLPPSRIDEETWMLEVTLPSGRGARTVRVSEGRAGRARVEGATNSVLVQLRHMFRLDEDLSGFYAVARDDPQLAWAAAGAGRMLRSPTVFEDVVKTICTTNCAWGGTVRMVTALVDHLGIASPTGGHTFPRPRAMAEAGL